MIDKPKKTPAARLTLVVEYDEEPDFRGLSELIEKARELGGVERADFERLRLVKLDLKNRF